jgi:tetratricopeptide (TPR) repeat protein
VAKKRISATVQTRINDRKLREGVERAEGLMSRARWPEAAQLLQDLDRAHPQRPEILQALIECSVKLGDTHLYQYGCETLYRIRPSDPDLPYMLTSAYIKNAWPALALSMATGALTRDPGNEKAEQTRKLIEQLAPLVHEQMQAIGLTGPDGLECFCMHDQVRSLLAQGRYAKAWKVAEALAERRPQFPPAYNNGAEACFHDGEIARAIELTKRLLAFDPDNVFAQSNLIRFQCIFGKVDEARKLADRLKTIEPVVKDLALKQAEAFAYLGDDAAVLAVYEKGRVLPSGDAHEDAVLSHLAAAAACRQGQEETAREYWLASLRAKPHFDLARNNLDDLKQPPAVRNAPWSFDMRELVPQKLIQGLATRVCAGKGEEEDSLAKAAFKYLDSHPELEGLVPLLLDKSEAAGRELALHLAGVLRTPAIIRAVRDFALGQRGSDQLRVRAAHIATEAGALSEADQRLWLQGEWHTSPLRRFEINGEPVPQHHAPGVLELINEAGVAMRGGDAARTARILEKAMTVDPDDPVVMNNLAQAYGNLGREQEAEALTIRLHQRHPDYLFARLSLANLAVQRGRLERARELLQPLLSRKRFHFGEFAALCAAMIKLDLAEGKPEAARSWLDMWRASMPDHPGLAEYERRIGNGH